MPDFLELFRGSSGNPLRVLSNAPKFLVKSERWESPWGRQEGSWVKNLTRGYSQAWIVHQHNLISFDWDIHKCPLPFRSCFTWWLVKIVFFQERVLKHLLSEVKYLQAFEGREDSFDQLSWTSKIIKLPSMGSHRVGHNWSDLAAAATAGTQVPSFKLTLPRLFLPFHGHIDRKLYRGLAMWRWVLELNFV